TVRWSFHCFPRRPLAGRNSSIRSHWASDSSYRGESIASTRGREQGVPELEGQRGQPIHRTRLSTWTRTGYSATRPKSGETVSTVSAYSQMPNNTRYAAIPTSTSRGSTEYQRNSASVHIVFARPSARYRVGKYSSGFAARARRLTYNSNIFLNDLWTSCPYLSNRQRYFSQSNSRRKSPSISDCAIEMRTAAFVASSDAVWMICVRRRVEIPRPAEGAPGGVRAAPVQEHRDRGGRGQPGLVPVRPAVAARGPANGPEGP